MNDIFEGKQLDKSIPVPLYYQLKEILLDYVQSNEQDGTLPPEVEICRRFDISRPTVRQAINELVANGYLERFKGKGTFIAKRKIRQDYLLMIESFHNEMHGKGLTHDTRVLELAAVPANEHVGAVLRIPPSSEVVKLFRLRSVNAEPIVLVQTYLPHALYPGMLTKDFKSNSLYHIVETEYGQRIKRSTRTIEAIKADEYLAGLLVIAKGDPIQFIESISYLEGDTPFEYTRAYYRGDRNRFTFELTEDKVVHSS